MKKLVCIEASHLQVAYTTVVEIANEIECAFVIGFIISPSQIHHFVTNTYAHNLDNRIALQSEIPVCGRRKRSQDG